MLQVDFLDNYERVSFIFLVFLEKDYKVKNQKFFVKFNGHKTPLSDRCRSF